MRSFELKALGLEALKENEVLINGGNNLGTLGPSGFYPTDRHGNIVDKVCQYAEDAYDWACGFFHGLFG